MLNCSYFKWFLSDAIVIIGFLAKKSFLAEKSYDSRLSSLLTISRWEIAKKSPVWISQYWTACILRFCCMIFMKILISNSISCTILIDLCEYFSPETPLTRAVTVSNATRIIIALVSGGAHLDFRNAKGLTAMHIAAIKGKEESIKVFTVPISLDYSAFRYLSESWNLIIFRWELSFFLHYLEATVWDVSRIEINFEENCVECKSEKKKLLFILLFV